MLFHTDFIVDWNKYLKFYLNVCDVAVEYCNIFLILAAISLTFSKQYRVNGLWDHAKN